MAMARKLETPLSQLPLKRDSWSTVSLSWASEGKYNFQQARLKNTSPALALSLHTPKTSPENKEELKYGWRTMLLVCQKACSNHS